MENDGLKAELDQVAAELVAARAEYASMGAKVAGLEARHAALVKAIPTMAEPGDRGIGLPGRYRTEDIVEVLAASGADLTISEVMDALAAEGRDGESYDNISVDLAYLTERGRITRVRRGVYAVARDPQPGPDRIVITLTQGNLSNKHVYLAQHLEFFPADAIGAPNKQDGQGRHLSLQFDGVDGEAETDIAPDHKIFRTRDWHWREFFQRHGLQAGDKIAIERISERRYRILPIPSRQAK